MSCQCSGCNNQIDKVYINVYTIHRKELKILMETAKLFSNGGSQAVRLPKNCRIQGTDEVLVNHIGNIVIIMPVEDISL